jgi:competence ComEA-like helix-hairpin-helix protein
LGVVAVLAIGLIVGMLIRFFSGDFVSNSINKSEVLASLDSLAEVYKTTYIGTDPDGKPIPELATGDTIVKDDNIFPAGGKKLIPTSKIDINTATKEQLMQLPGVGPSMADRIIEHRKKFPFSKPSDIIKIRGIGPNKYDKMVQYIHVSTPTNQVSKTSESVTNSQEVSKDPSQQQQILNKLDLNTASKVQLMRLPNVGESTAQKIIEYRKETPFRQIEDLMKVKGIGEKKFQKIKPFIFVK